MARVKILLKITATEFLWTGNNDYLFNAGSNVKMFGRVGDDSLVNGDSESVADNVKMDGGSGNDYMVSRGNKVTMLGGVNVLFKYASGDGNDTIVGFNSTSTLQIGNGTGTYSMNETGDDVIVKVGNGSVTLNGAASLYSVNIRGTRKYTSSTTLTLTNSSKSSVALGSAVETADASTRTKNTKITGNALANTIQGGSKKIRFTAATATAKIQSSASTITIR